MNSIGWAKPGLLYYRSTEHPYCFRLLTGYSNFDKYEYVEGFKFNAEKTPVSIDKHLLNSALYMPVKDPLTYVLHGAPFNE